MSTATAQPAPIRATGHFRWRTDWLMTVLLIVSTLALYWPVRTYDFVNFDDEDYVKENPHVIAGLTKDSIRWAFTTAARSNWHPLTWLSYQLDVEMFGLEGEPGSSEQHPRAGPIHLENAVIHAINAALLYALLVSMTSRRSASAWVAAMFALHPLHVESVAWVAERKDVLSTLLLLLTLLAYVRYVRRLTPANYVIVLALFALGLMAKPMLVTLPCVMLLLDIWPLRRLWEASLGPPRLWTRTRAGALIAEKLPLFLLAIASSAITYAVQSAGRSVATTSGVPVSIRIANTIASYATYLRMTVAPYGLAVFYPHPVTYPGGSISAAVIAISAAVLIVATISAIVLRLRMPWLLIGWLWYLGMLFPVIGLMQVGRQAMADRYTYVPLVGIFIAIAWTTAWLAKLKPAPGRAVAWILAIGSIAGSAVASFRQIGYWRDSETLMRRAIAVVPSNYLAHASLGRTLEDKGRIDEARAEYDAALRINPEESTALYNRAVEAQQRGDTGAAVPLYQRAIRADPEYFEAYNEYGNLLAQSGQSAEAIRVYRAAIARGADLPQIYSNLAMSLADQKQLDEAISNWQEALKLNPKYADAHYRLGLVLITAGRGPEGLRHLRNAVALKPDRAEYAANLAWILATHPSTQLQDGSAAVQLAQKATEISKQNPVFLDTLAAAYARAGKFEQAAQTAQSALALAQQQSKSELVKQIEHRISLYQMNQPYTAGQ